MQVYIAFLLVAVLIGGTERCRQIRDHPALVLALCAVVAASFYSLRVVL